MSGNNITTAENPAYRVFSSPLKGQVILSKKATMEEVQKALGIGGKIKVSVDRLLFQDSVFESPYTPEQDAIILGLALAHGFSFESLKARMRYLVHNISVQEAEQVYGYEFMNWARHLANIIRYKNAPKKKPKKLDQKIDEVLEKLERMEKVLLLLQESI